jgi:hypothetical protein
VSRWIDAKKNCTNFRHHLGEGREGREGRREGVINVGEREGQIDTQEGV